jgi:hypothetical protein
MISTQFAVKNPDFLWSMILHNEFLLTHYLMHSSALLISSIVNIHILVAILTNGRIRAFPLITAFISFLSWWGEEPPGTAGSC